MNKKLMIVMLVVGASAFYVRFQVVGMESGDRIEQARQEEERRRAAGEAGRAAQVPETEASEVSTGPSEEVIKNNMDQMWKYEIGKRFPLPLPPKVEAFLCHKLCITTIVRTLQHDGLIHSVAFIPDGKLLITGALDGRVVIWDIASGNRVETLRYGRDVSSVAFNPAEGLLATGSFCAAVIWDVTSGSRVQTLQYNGLVHSVAFSPDGRLLAIGSGDKTADIWNVESWNKVRTLQCGKQAVLSVAFSPDGRLLATGTWDVVDIWDVANGQKLKTLQCGGWVLSVSFSPDGRLLATGEVDGTAGIWSVASGLRLQTLQCGGNVNFHSVSFSPDGRLLATASGSNASLWNVECLQILEKSISTTPAQYKLIQEFELTFENKRDWWKLGKKRPVGRIQATSEQWATFLTLPQKVQELLRKRIRNPYERMAGPVSSSDKEEEGKGSDTDYYDALSEMDVE